MGASPDSEMVKLAPFESYVGESWAVKSLEAPSGKLILNDFPRAGSGGQADDSVGLQLVYVCAAEGDEQNMPAMVAKTNSRRGGAIANMFCSTSIINEHALFS